MATNAWNMPQYQDPLAGIGQVNIMAPPPTVQPNAPAVEQPMPVTRSRREIIDPDDIVGYYKTYRGTTADEEAPEVARAIEAGMKEMRKVAGSRRMSFNEYKNVVESVASGLNLPFPEWTEQAKARLFTRGIDAGFGKMAEDEAKRKEERIKVEEEAASKYELGEELAKKYGRGVPREMTAEEKQKADLDMIRKKSDVEREIEEQRVDKMVASNPGYWIKVMNASTKLSEAMPRSRLPKQLGNDQIDEETLADKANNGFGVAYFLYPESANQPTEPQRPAAPQPAAQPTNQTTGVRFYNQDKSAMRIVTDPALIEKYRASGRYIEE